MDDWNNLWQDAGGNDINMCDTGPQSPVRLVTKGSKTFREKNNGDALESSVDGFSFMASNLQAPVGWDMSRAALGF